MAPHFLSLSQAVWVVGKYGFSFDYLPSTGATGLPSRLWKDLFTERVSDAVRRLRPAVVVFDGTRPGPDPAAFPMFVYDHTEERCAIIGGYVVRDPNLPALWGRYLYGDSCTGEVRSFVPRVAAQEAAGEAPTGITLPGLSTFGEGIGGKIYAAQIGGQVWRIEPAP